MTATLTITEFLLARITEDEAMWAPAAPLVRPFPITLSDASGADIVSITVDPARVLAECEARRRIVALHFEMDGGAPETFPYTSTDGRTVWPGCAVCDEGSPQRPHCDTIRALAAVYAEHPDYSADWKP